MGGKDWRPVVVLRWPSERDLDCVNVYLIYKSRVIYLGAMVPTTRTRVQEGVQ